MTDWKNPQDQVNFNQFQQGPRENYELLSPFVQPSPYGSEYHFGEEQSFSPLISPAITPNVNFNQLSFQTNSNQFTELTSPALQPQHSHQLEQMNMHGGHMQDSPMQESYFNRSSSSPYIGPKKGYVPSPLVSSQPFSNSYENTNMQRQASNQFFSLLPPSSASDSIVESNSATPKIAPVTPSQLMQLNSVNNNEFSKPEPGRKASRKKSNANLKPLLPFVQDSGKAAPTAAHVLAYKSNYQTLLEGQGEHLGVGKDSQLANGVKHRKISHKEAEQQRRDKLKHAFKVVKAILPPMKDKNPSKVMVLKKGNVLLTLAKEYILDIIHEKEQQYEELKGVNAYVSQLQQLLTQSGIQFPEYQKYVKAPRVKEANDGFGSDEDD
ncbi:hypothetical protein HK103_004728 [Boothiomyces macroporosus]|uniref:BHLH domain-containing protein n=1 Tax=Boothiomyces macroporosus TaxID=261099 RepID=A0AAD5UN20_9FUNG|nr:hypothetical protein HK103_004728 [Boothiomyces macroporosus]